jgi:hypothetical protein
MLFSAILITLGAITAFLIYRETFPHTLKGLAAFLIGFGIINAGLELLP